MSWSSSSSVQGGPIGGVGHVIASGDFGIVSW